MTHPLDRQESHNPPLFAEAAGPFLAGNEDPALSNSRWFGAISLDANVLAPLGKFGGLVFGLAAGYQLGLGDGSWSAEWEPGDDCSCNDERKLPDGPAADISGPFAQIRIGMALGRTK